MARKRRSVVKVLGVDPSLTSTGLATPSGACMALKTDFRGWERISYILGKIEHNLKLDPPTHICMEGYAFSRGRVGRVFDLAELGGCMKLLFLSKGLPIILVPPTTLKIYASGEGNAKKEFVMKEIKARWKRSFVSSDMADAFALQKFGQDYLLASSNLRERGAGMLRHESVGEVRALGKASVIEPEKTLQSFASFG